MYSGYGRQNSIKLPVEGENDSVSDSLKSAEI